MLNLLEELCITREANVNSFAKVLKYRGSIYIYIYICVCVFKEYLALNNHQKVICHKTKKTNITFYVKKNYQYQKYFQKFWPYISTSPNKETCCCSDSSERLSAMV